jgi:hypothetical protein
MILAVQRCFAALYSQNHTGFTGLIRRTKWQKDSIDPLAAAGVAEAV